MPRGVGIHPPKRRICHSLTYFVGLGIIYIFLAAFSLF
jgi:hypothetical protein